METTNGNVVKNGKPLAVASAPATSPDEVRHLPLASIVASKTNPRQTFSEAKLAELAASIERSGVIQPVTVRPTKDGKFELVFGERRLRASRIAGKATIPALVREIADDLIFDMQIVENLQREDITELEEAEAYERMRAKGMTGEEIAARVGKTKAYVYARLKLCALVPSARKALAEGAISASVALLVARVPAADQPKALEIVGGRNGRLISARDAASELRDRFMLQLAKAPFDTVDAKLVAAAGACGPCPKRTGNAPELFEDVKGADVCTDPGCYRGKVEAALAVKAKAAGAPAPKTLTPQQLAKAFPYRDGHLDRFNSGFLNLDEVDHSAGGRKTYRQQLGDKAAELEVVAVDPTGVVRRLASVAAVEKALVALGVRKASRGSSVGVGGAYDYKAAEKRQRERDRERRRQEEAKARVRGALIEAVALKLPEAAFVKLLVHVLIGDGGRHSGVVAKRRGWAKDSWSAKAPDLRARASKLTPAQLRALAVDLAIENMPEGERFLSDVGALVGVDVGAALKKELGAAPASPAAKAKKAAKKK